MINHLKDATPFSPLHRQLMDTKKRLMCPTYTMLFSFLKDVDAFTMREEMVDLFLKWSQEAYGETSPNAKCIEYAHRVLYPVICDHLEGKYFDTQPSVATSYTISGVLPVGYKPCYHPITSVWQQEICKKMKVDFFGEMDQHRALTGLLLSHYIPWQCSQIERDGNCFFRCFSLIISGTQDYHKQLRGEICRYIVTEGREFIQKYLRTKFFKDTSPLTYLKQSAMTEDGIWASDVEIIAISRILDTHIFVATQTSCPKKSWERVQWLRYCGSNSPETACIYIANYNDHFEPVIRLMNCTYVSFNSLDSIESIVVND